MLEQMRKHMNWIMWTILVMIIISFLFFGIYPASDGSGAAATVNGDVITATEVNRVYQNMYETYRQIFKDQFSDSLAKNLRSQALRDLINNKLLIQEAKRIGLRVSDEEVRDAIMKVPSFSVQGRFDKAVYDRYLEYINQKPSAFEETQREYLLRQKMDRLVEDGVDVADAELVKEYAARNPKAKKGDFEKNRDSFRKTVLSDKRRAASEAFVQGLYRTAKVTTNKSVAEW
ncbi:MAG: SurA N-terminal domain-containing protein [Nitrospirota bacterium]|nr:SurA N-terminal domain-containing protein [Nitrospirota bacterium]